MPTYDRSGMNLQTFKLGRVKCLRQEYMVAGEVMRPNIKGYVRLGSLREPMALDVKVDLCTFFTPLRFIDDNWIDYIKDGPDTLLTMPTTTVSVSGAHRMDVLGIGAIEGSDVIWEAWVKSYNNLWNWNFKFPDDTSVSLTDTPTDQDDRRYGRKAVNLPSYETRVRATETEVTNADFQVPLVDSNTKVSLRDLNRYAAEFRAEIARDWLASDRYAEIMQHEYGVNVDDNAEGRPYMLDHISGWMSGRDLYATDGSSLGQVAGVQKFEFDHNPGVIIAPEHGILSYVMVIRWPPMFDDHSNPLTAIDDWEWHDFTGNPSIIANTEPKEILARTYRQRQESTDSVGWHPAGQHFRTGYNIVDGVIAERDSFPIQSGSNNTRWYVDSAEVDDAFSSLSLGHGLGAIKFTQIVESPIPLPMGSIMSGAS